MQKEVYLITVNVKNNDFALIMGKSTLMHWKKMQKN